MSLANVIGQWREEWARRDAWRALGPAGRAAIARDILVPEETLSGILARGPRTGTEIDRLLGALSLDPQEIARCEAETMRDMRVVCAGCPAVRRCRRDLDAGESARNHARYCPNATTIAGLKEEMRAAPAA